MENRWQPMPPAQPRQPRPADQPLRACCVGGMAIHKGLAVLQAALLQARLPAPGLQLTLVDASLEADGAYALQWGDALVQVQPSVPMAAMPAFYAAHDLLIAPSIWPESYGLVTREALSAGLWVIASDIGALAEPIRHGENGHRLPPGDPVALAAVLEQLCAHHPTPQPLLSFNGTQGPLGLELDRLYSRLLARA
jgi:glycosyltransferase involved in cell wall biosynthesis